MPLWDLIMYDIILGYIDFQSFPTSFTIRKFKIHFTKEIGKL